MTTAVLRNGQATIALRCDCHDLEVLGIVHDGGTLVIRDGRHGTKHSIRLSPIDVLIAMCGAQEPNAIVNYVVGVIAQWQDSTESKPTNGCTISGP